MSGEKKLYCSFCGKSETEVAAIVTSPGANICDDCVLECSKLIVGIVRKEATANFPHGSMGEEV